MADIMKTTRIPSQPSGISLPPAGEWVVETQRSAISFSGKASRIAPTVKATFGDVRGGLHLAEDPNGSRVGVCVDVRTITTGNPLWDDMLRVADPFKAAAHPLAHFMSSAVRWTGAGFDVTGVLELAGAATPLTLAAAVRENADTTVLLQAHGTIDPRSAGISLNVPGARLLMPRAMKLSIAVIASRAPVRSTRGRKFALAS
jgi:polyisoprenoid-binding protein YceI